MSGALLAVVVSVDGLLAEGLLGGLLEAMLPVALDEVEGEGLLDAVLLLLGADEVSVGEDLP